MKKLILVLFLSLAYSISAETTISLYFNDGKIGDVSVSNYNDVRFGINVHSTVQCMASSSTYSSNKWKIDSGGSLTFKASSGYWIKKVVINGTLDNNYEIDNINDPSYVFQLADDKSLTINKLTIFCVTPNCSNCFEVVY